MKIVIAPDSFKESLSALQVADAVRKGFSYVFPDADYVLVPMADGGEGTVQSLVDATGGTIVHTKVTGPLGDQVNAFFGLLGDRSTAVIEMAAASGLHLVPVHERNPLLTTTKGTGELILAAIEAGAETVILGLGGSATNDGGAGMAQALGVRLLDEQGRELAGVGGELHRVHRIDVNSIDTRIAKVRFVAACDVDNPLTGANGASAVFGPQKGASPEIVRQLDSGLSHYAAKLFETLNTDVEHVPGAGAAGGLGAGVVAFLNAELKRGVDIVIEAANLERHMEGADLVITGEGRIDSQTVHGKTPYGVAQTAKKFDIPVIAIAGSLSPDSDLVHEHGIDALFSVVPGVCSLEDALKEAEANIVRTARNIAAAFKMGNIIE